MDIAALKLPSTFKFPTQLDYVANMGSAMKSLGGFNGEFMRNNLAAPVLTSLNTLIIGIEATVGTQIKNLEAMVTQGLDSVRKFIPPAVLAKLGDVGKIASGVVSFVGAVVSGNVQVAVAEGVKIATAVMNMVGLAVGTVPVIGQVAQGALAIVQLIISLLPPSNEEIEAGRKQARAALDARLIDRCSKEAQGWAQITASRSTGPTPGDQFRSAYVAAILGRPLPPTVASMFILMCGGESQGVGFTRNEYNSTWHHARSVYGKKWVGIDPEVQRRMWELCKSIMFSTEDPSLSKTFTFIGDGGVMAFAALQDIVRNQWRAGNWDPQWVGLLSSYLGGRYSECEPVIVDGKPYGDPVCDSCGGLATMKGGEVRSKMGLDSSFLAVQQQWQLQLRDLCDSSKSLPKGSTDQCVWRATAPPGAALAAKRPSPTGAGTIVLTEGQARSLAMATGVSASEAKVRALGPKKASGGQLSLGAKVGIGAGILVVGAGALALMRRS